MRENEQQQFLAAHGWDKAVCSPIAGDASFRRYARLELGGKRAIVMDAPPGKEDIRPFVTVANYLRRHGLSAPDIIAADEGLGFMLLEDLGDSSYSKMLVGKGEEGSRTEMALYEQAIDVLISLHNQPVAENLPHYDEALLLREAGLLLEWYFPVLNGERLSAKLEAEYYHLWQQLIKHLNALPQVVVLRDYHADNLMWLPERVGVKKVGLLDFQDAVIGSPAYDMVSLLEDARRDVGEDTVAAMINRYLAAMPATARKDFLASYAILGAQRNCKIIGIFTRLSARDGKASYLKLLPRVWRHVMHDVKHPLLTPLKQWLMKVEVLNAYREPVTREGKGA